MFLCGTPLDPARAGIKATIDDMSVFPLEIFIAEARLGEQLFFWMNALFPLITGSIASYYRYFSVIPTYFLRLF